MNIPEPWREGNLKEKLKLLQTQMKERPGLESVSGREG